MAKKCGWRKLYVVVRKDLPEGTSAAQVAHALTEFSFKYPRDFQCWHEASNTIVVLQIPDMTNLVRLCDQAWFSGVRRAEFREEDLNGDLTAVCFEPGSKTERMLKGVELL